jgi:diguanylate cyclase (GGDEF)-like protein
MRILIAEDDTVSCHLLKATLTKLGHEVVVTHDGLEAWEALQQPDAPSMAILDWMMPLLDGTEICRKVRADALTSHTYIILLSAMGSKANLIEGLEAGADDYLVKPFDRYELKVRLEVGGRIIELQRVLAERVRELEASVVERKRAEEALRNLTLADDLTGLFNRRGFFTLAQQQLKTVRRRNQSSLLIYADMDGLKRINDTYGHSEGSNAICRVADILTETFRDSDIIARLGGDEFAILAADVPPLGNILVTDRLRENLRRYNQTNELGYELSLSIGSISVEPGTPSTIEELVDAADLAMYANKRGKTGSPLGRDQLSGPRADAHVSLMTAH